MAQQTQSQQPQKIYHRSPRYVLQLKDKKIMRYASFPRGHRSFFTDIINLSETGMAFTVPYLDTPHKNEIIMVEFTAPDGNPIACFGQVRRIQKFSIIESDAFEKNCKLVGVQFMNMKDEQKTILKSSLNDEFKQSRKNFHREQRRLKIKWFFKTRRKQIAIAAGTLTGVASAVGFAAYYFMFLA